MSRRSDGRPPSIPPDDKVFEIELNPMQAQLMRLLLEEVAAQHEQSGCCEFNISSDANVPYCSTKTARSSSSSSKSPAGAAGNAAASQTSRSSGTGSSPAAAAASNGSKISGPFFIPVSRDGNRSAVHGTGCGTAAEAPPDIYMGASWALASVGMTNTISPLTVDRLKSYLLSIMTAAAEITGSTSCPHKKQQCADLQKRLRQDLNSCLADLSQQLPAGLPKAARQPCQLMSTAVQQALTAALLEQQQQHRQQLPNGLEYVFESAETLTKISWIQAIVTTMDLDMDAQGIYEESMKLYEMLNIKSPGKAYAAMTGKAKAAAAAAAAAAPAAAAGSSAWGSEESLAGLKGLFPRGNSSSSSTTTTTTTTSYSKVAASGASNAEAAAAAASKTGKATTSSDGSRVVAAAAGSAAAAAAAASKPAAAAAKQAAAPTSMPSLPLPPAANKAAKKSANKSAAPVARSIVEISKHEVEQKFCSVSVYSLPHNVEATPSELAAIQKYKLHLAEGCVDENRKHMWSTLHYAVSGGKCKLVQQLLDIGADPAEPEPLLQLSSLHLACVGRPRDITGANMFAASKSIYTFQEFCQHSGPPDHQIVNLLLNHGVDPNISISSGSLAGITPLHILCCCAPAAGSSSGSSSSKQGKIKDALDVFDGFDAVVQEQMLCISSLLSAGANAGASTSVNAETPMTFAATCGAFPAVLVLGDHPSVRDVCREVVVNRPRLMDGARPLDIALEGAMARTAMCLLLAGADPVPHGSHHASYQKLPFGELKPELRPQMALLNALQCGEGTNRPKLLHYLLGRGAGIWLEEEWTENSETALMMAIRYDDVECVELLVAAGADVNHFQAPLPPPVFMAATTGNTDILKILLDAGADFVSFIHPATNYDIVQSAACHGHLEAVKVLVEAGAPWWLPRGQRSDNGTILYVPEIITCERPAVKLSFIEGQLKHIEKQNKKRRETAEKALEPFLIGASSECKAATIAVAHRIGLSLREAAAAAAGVGVGVELNGAADDVDALAAAIEGLGSGSSGGGSGSSKKAKKKQKARAQQQQQPSDHGPEQAEELPVQFKDQQQQQQQQQQQEEVEDQIDLPVLHGNMDAAAAAMGLNSAAVDDVDALAAEFEGLGSSAAGGSSGSSKKAKKKQKARMQQQQQPRDHGPEQAEQQPLQNKDQQQQQQQQEEEEEQRAEEDQSGQPEIQGKKDAAAAAVGLNGAAVDDVDALAAAIEALGSSAPGGSSNSKKAKKKQKAKAQQQQQQAEPPEQGKLLADQPASAVVGVLTQQQQQQPGDRGPEQHEHHHHHHQQQQQEDNQLDQLTLEIEFSSDVESEDELLGDVSLEDLQRFATAQQDRRSATRGKVYTAGDPRLRKKPQQQQQPDAWQQQQQQQQQQQVEAWQQQDETQFDPAAAEYVGAQLDVAELLADFTANAEQATHKEIFESAQQAMGKQQQQQQQQQEWQQEWQQESLAAQKLDLDSWESVWPPAVQAVAGEYDLLGYEETHAVTTDESAVGREAANADAAMLPQAAAEGWPPAAAPAAAAAELSAPAAAGSGRSALQNWRGSLNPIFMYNRPGSTGGSTSSAVVAAAAAQPADGMLAQGLAAVPGAQQQQQSTGGAAALQVQQQQQVLNRTAPTLQPQQRPIDQQRPAPGSPGLPTAMMEALNAGSAVAAVDSANAQQQQQQQQQQLLESQGKAAASVAASSAGTRKTKAGNKCVVCMERKCDMLLLPCKHIVMCAVCADEMNGRGGLKECPGCRASVVQRIKVLSP